MPYAPAVHRHAGYRTASQRKAAHDAQRGTSAQRGYDKAWQKLSKEFRAQNPFCQCDEHRGLDLTALAEVVDHKQPIATHPELRLEWSNLRSMTKRCHDRRTAKEQAFGRPPALKGYVNP